MSYRIPPLTDKSVLKSQGYTNGKWVNAKSGETFEVLDPASGKVIGTMPDMGREDTQNAINAAAALPSWSKTTSRVRARMLHRWYQFMMENADDLAKLIAWENGKPLHEAISGVKYAADYFEWFSEETPQVY
jgi:succinate-semialdehyde dehydrogenase/glutarate-semialdehyde dehydrogenase